MFEKEESIKALPFYDKLTDEQKKMIFNNSEIKSFTEGEILSGLVHNCMGPFLILKGEVRAVLTDENFREITLFKLYPNEIALLSAACVIEFITFDAQFVVGKDSVLLLIGAQTIKKIMEENLPVRCNIFETLTDRFSFCMLTMYELLFTRYDRRMAAFLVERYIYTGETEFKITQKELAKMTSSVREVAGRTIRQFAKDGLVEYGRGRIKLIDIKRLKELM